MIMTEQLKAMAAKSPEKYAQIILERNTKLLETLEKWYSLFKEDQSQLGSFENFQTAIRCPHCDNYQCEFCLWNKIYPNKSELYLEAFPDNIFKWKCCTVLFNGVSYHEAGQNQKNRQYAGFLIEYTEGSAGLQLHLYVGVCDEEVESTYINCKKFLEGHIEWAKLDCWGTKCEGKE